MGSKYHKAQPIQTVMQVLLLAVLVCGLAACGEDSVSDVSSAAIVPTRTLVPPTATPTPPNVPTTPTPTDLPGPESLRPTDTAGKVDPLSYDAIVAHALDDLLDTQNVDADDARLMSLDAVIWQDDTWGCESYADGEPGRAVETPGYRVIFGADSRVFVYHTDEYGGLRLCEDRQWLTLMGEPVLTEPIAAAMVDLSRSDAARQLDVSEEDLHLAGLLTLTWTDASIGCPKAGVDYDDRETPGYRIVFTVNGESVIYHTSVREVVRCAAEEEILPGVLRRALPDADDEQ